MEKEQHDSMATVQMTKADYAASEVYSTTSEPPPVSHHFDSLTDPTQVASRCTCIFLLSYKKDQFCCIEYPPLNELTNKTETLMDQKL